MPAKSQIYLQKLSETNWTKNQIHQKQKRIFQESRFCLITGWLNSYILVQEKTIVTEKCAKINTYVPSPHIPPWCSFWDSTGYMSMGGEGGDAFLYYEE